MSISVRNRAGARLIILMLVSVCRVCAAGNPEAVFLRPAFNFPSAVRGEIVEHEFIVENRGSAPLRILKTSMTPPLLATALPSLVAPGAQAALGFRLDTNQLKGRFDGVIVVFLNDPNLPAARLAFRGQVLTPVAVLPAPMLNVAARRGHSASAHVDIVNRDASPLKVYKIEHPDDRFSTSLETIENGQRYRLTLTLNPDGPGGENSGIILVHTSNKAAPVLRIRANTALLDRVFVSPSHLQLGSLPLTVIQENPGLAQQFVRILTVHGDQTNFQIEARTNLPYLRLRLRPAPKGGGHQVIITLAPDKLRAGPIRGSIVILTNDAEFQKITVPVSGLVVER
jgi:hypothetical protein